jgi:hypothetical protein
MISFTDNTRFKVLFWYTSIKSSLLPLIVDIECNLFKLSIIDSIICCLSLYVNDNSKTWLPSILEIQKGDSDIKLGMKLIKFLVFKNKYQFI